MMETGLTIALVAYTIATLMLAYKVYDMKVRFQVHRDYLTTILAAMDIHLKHHHDKFGECQPSIQSFKNRLVEYEVQEDLTHE